MSDVNMFEKVCKPRLEEICGEVKANRGDISEIKKKVFNGFGEAQVRIEDKIEKLDKRMDKMDNRQWATLVMLFACLAGILIPKVIPEKQAVRQPMIEVVQDK